MCAACKATGDAARLAAWAVAGRPDPTPAGWESVRDVLARYGWCSAPDAPRGTWTPTPRAPVAPDPWPDPTELRRLLGACRPVPAVPEVAAWVAGRGMDPALVPAAVLPDVAPWPPWWPFRGRPWRLVVSAVDALGVPRSIHARATEDTDRGKTRWPLERRCQGLVFADPRVARPMLQGLARPARVVVCEGVTDYLAAAQHATTDRGGLAVLGAASGGFAALRDAAVPADAVVYAWTDHDAAGDRYAAEIVAALPDHDVRRVRAARSRM